MSETIATEKLKQKPIIIKKCNSKKTILTLKNLKIPTQLYKEHKIYESKPGDFLNGEPHTKVVLTNQFNMISNSSRTIAQYISLSENKITEKTSDSITKLIGQKNYDTIFAALCSVISQELKVRGMLALLSEKEQPTVKEEEDETKITEDSTEMLKMKQKRRRNRLTPYVVKDKKSENIPIVKRVIIDPIKSEINDTEIKVKTEDPLQMDEQKPELVQIDRPFDEDSSHSLESNVSLLSGHTNISHISLMDKTNQILQSIDQNTEEPYENESQSLSIQLNEHILMPDGSRIMVPIKPEDDFHIATPDILRNVTNEERKRLLWYQAYKDWKLCLERDEDGLLPLHNAVLNNDVDLVRRQSLVLRNRLESLDIMAANRTALQMAIKMNNLKCATILLQYGADPLVTDEENRTALHLAAELCPDLLRAVLRYCQNNAADILQDRELWSPFMENKSKVQLTSYLMDHVCQMIDNQGYTALMLAAKIGHHTNVTQLIEASPSTTNMSMPNCGNTALYLAVAAACLDTVDSSNRSKVADNFIQTITVLLENGADPAIDNSSGQNVNILLTEFNIAELSMLIANKVICLKYFNGNMPGGSKNFDSYMLIKDKKENIKLAHLEKPKIKTVEIKKDEKPSGSKPKILENVPVVKTCLPNLKDFRKISPKEKLGINKKFSNTQQIKLEPVSISPTKIDMKPVQTQVTPFVMTHTKMADSKNKDVDKTGNSFYFCRMKNMFVKSGIKSSTIINPTLVNAVIKTEKTEDKTESKKRLTVVTGPTTKKQRLLKSLEQ